MEETPETPTPTLNRLHATSCLLWPSLLAIALLAGGVAALTYWDTLPGYGKSAGILFTVVGSLLLLPIVAILAIKFWLWRLLGRMSQAVDNMIENNRALYGSVHEFREATAADFGQLDRGYYDAAQQSLAQLGFVLLGDLVDATIALSGEHVIRVMTSTDRKTVVGVYQFVPHQMPDHMADQPIQCCEFISEFTDGTDLTTTNIGNLDPTTPRPTKIVRKFPRGTPPHLLYQAHCDEMLRLLTTQSGATPILINTLDEAIESQQRMLARTAAFRQDIGYVDASEVERIAAMTPDSKPDATRLIVNALEQAKANRKP